MTAYSKQGDRPGFHSLLVWKRAMSLAKETYLVVDSLPERERFGLADQMRRASISIPSNIAEGSKRSSKREYVQFLRIAHGSLAELETQLLLTRELYPKLETRRALQLALEVGRMLYAFARAQEC